MHAPHTPLTPSDPLQPPPNRDRIYGLRSLAVLREAVRPIDLGQVDIQVHLPQVHAYLEREHGCLAWGGMDRVRLRTMLKGLRRVYTASPRMRYQKTKHEGLQYTKDYKIVAVRMLRALRMAGRVRTSSSETRRAASILRRLRVAEERAEALRVQEEEAARRPPLCDVSAGKIARVLRIRLANRLANPEDY